MTLSRRSRWLKALRGAGRLQWLLIGLLAATSLLCVAAAGAYALWQAEPAYWREAQSEAGAAAQRVNEQQAALQLERRLISVLGSTPRARTVSISRTAANAWLHRRLPDWLAHRGEGLHLESKAPAQVEPSIESHNTSHDASHAAADNAAHDAVRIATWVRACRPTVATDDGELIIALRFPPNGQDGRIQSFHFRAARVSPTRAGLRLTRIRSGRLTLPMDLARSHLRALLATLDPGTQRWLETALSGEPFDPLASVAPGHSDDGGGFAGLWRLTDVKVGAKYVDLAFDAARH